MARSKTQTSPSNLKPQQQIQITLVRSPIGTPERHRLVLRSLGLRHLRQTVSRQASRQVQGMIRKVGYLLEVRPQ